MKHRRRCRRQESVEIVHNNSKKVLVNSRECLCRTVGRECLCRTAQFILTKAANAYAGRRRECLCRTAVQRMLMQDCTKQPRLMSGEVWSSRPSSLRRQASECPGKKMIIELWSARRNCQGRVGLCLPPSIQRNSLFLYLFKL